MGAAAYNRGSAAISRSLYGHDLRPNQPAKMRPASWGKKTAERAEADILWLSTCALRRGKPAPSIDDGADFAVFRNPKLSRVTALMAANRVLELGAP